jgi:hypothetical protein
MECSESCHTLLSHQIGVRLGKPPPADHLSAFNVDNFAPVPTHWKHIVSLPDHLKTPWIASLRKELLALLRMQTFGKSVTVSPDNIVVPVTAKFRIKLTSTGAKSTS